MGRKGSRKGISPLIAAVLLIAFTMAVGSIFAQWAPNLLQSIQQDTSEDAVDITRASNLGLEIMSVSFNRSSNQVEVVVQNTGEAIDDKTNISVGVIGDSVANTEQHNVDLSEKEITTISVPVDRTYPLETLQVSMTDYPVTDESSIRCTPTRGLTSYWSFNNEQTENGETVDLSGFGNDAVLGDSTLGDDAEPETGLTGVAGDSYRFRRDSNSDWINLSQSESLEGNRLSISTWVRFKDEDSDRQRIIQYTGSNGAMSHGYRLAINGGPSDDPLRFGIGDGSSNHFINAPFDGNEREWHFVTGDYNGTHLRIFVDGELKTVEQESMTISYSGVTNSETEIGNGFNPIKGKLDEMRVYNRSLSLSEIERLRSVRSEDWAIDACRLTG